MRITAAALVACVFAGSCQGVDEPESEAERPAPALLSSPLTLSKTFGINRIIPVRFVQFADASNPAKTDGELDEQVSRMNDVFGPAGIQFFVRANQTVSDTVFTAVDSSTSYTWPSPTSAAPPLAFNQNCLITLPTGGSEDEARALFRAGSYCSFDGEVLVFTAASTTFGSWGAYPWEANAIIMNRGDMNTGNETLAHEMGHYLGLPHVFKGGLGNYDLGNASWINPETGQPAKLSDAWDLVYKPGTGTTPHTFFTSRAAAAAFEGSLYQIQYEVNDGSMCGPSTCQAGQPAGSLKIVVDTAPAPARSELHYTNQTDGSLKGLGFVFPTGTPSVGVNVMSYNYPADPGASPASRGSISVSQIEQIQRTFTYEVNSGLDGLLAFSGTKGRRPWLGLGRGSWTNWESLGGNFTDRPAVVARVGTSNRIDVVVRNVDGSVQNKILQSNGWWPSQTTFASLGGNVVGPPSAAMSSSGRFDVTVRGASDQAIYHKYWDPATGAWWPSQTGWDSLGGFAGDSPVVGERATGEVDVMAIGTDGNAYNKVRNPSTGAWWPSQTGWAGIGPAAATPFLMEDSTGQTVTLLGIGSDGHAANKVWTASTGTWSPSQSGWQDLGSTASTLGSMTSWGSTHIDIVTRLTDGTVGNKVWTAPSTWWPSQTTWASLGRLPSAFGAPTGRVSSVAWGTGRLDVVMRGDDGTIGYKYWDSATSAWWPSQTDWAILGVGADGDPVITSWGANRLDIFVRGSDGTLMHRARIN